MREKFCHNCSKTFENRPSHDCPHCDSPYWDHCDDLLADANRDMLGDDADFFDGDMGDK